MNAFSFISDQNEAIRVTLNEWVEMFVNKYADKQPDPDAYRKEMHRLAKEVRPHLSAFLRNNRNLSAEELEDAAKKVSPPVGNGNEAMLARLMMNNVLCCDPLLLAATFRWNWHRDNYMGCPTLPDPREVDFDQYWDQTSSIIHLFDDATDMDPTRILTGRDLAFFERLPNRFTVYRGCAGISTEAAAAGICWTRRRDIAERFALNAAESGGGEPVLLSGKIWKYQARIAKALEHEIVTRPFPTRVLKIRRKTQRTVRRY